MQKGRRGKRGAPRGGAMARKNRRREESLPKQSIGGVSAPVVRSVEMRKRERKRRRETGQISKLHAIARRPDVAPTSRRKIEEDEEDCSRRLSSVIFR